MYQGKHYLYLTKIVVPRCFCRNILGRIISLLLTCSNIQALLCLFASFLWACPNFRGWQTELLNWKHSLSPSLWPQGLWWSRNEHVNRLTLLYILASLSVLGELYTTRLRPGSSRSHAFLTAFLHLRSKISLVSGNKRYHWKKKINVARQC